MTARAFACLIILSVCAAASVQPAAPKTAQLVPSEPEQKLWKTIIRSAEFSDIPHSSARARCADTQPPEALTTPKPLSVPALAGSDVKISFIVGTDGHVHSPLILKSAGPAGDRNILQTVRGWRYRPAMCNGVPTEAEGRIDFSRR